MVEPVVGALIVCRARIATKQREGIPREYMSVEGNTNGGTEIDACLYTSVDRGVWSAGALAVAMHGCIELRADRADDARHSSRSIALPSPFCVDAATRCIWMQF